MTTAERDAAQRACHVRCWAVAARPAPVLGAPGHAVLSDGLVSWLEFLLLESLDVETPATILIDQPLGASATMEGLTTIANEGFIITGKPQ